MKSRIAVIIASVDPAVEARSRIARFASEVSGRGEVLVVDATPDACGERSARGLRNVRVLKRPSGMLAPELWRDGLSATNTPLVAFSTTAMAPEPGRLDAMLECLKASGAAGVGGPIVPGDGLNATEHAIYLLRYVHYFSASCFKAEPEPPGDNAVYRRDRLESAMTLIERGFWEAEVHRALRARGERFEMAEHGRVIYQGGGQLLSNTYQRFRHAMIYGSSRAREMSVLERLVRISASPLVPPLMLRRIGDVLRSQNISIRSWIHAMPALSILATAWAIGEAVGTCQGVGQSPRCEPRLKTLSEIV